MIRIVHVVASEDQDWEKRLRCEQTSGTTISIKYTSVTSQSCQREVKQTAGAKRRSSRSWYFIGILSRRLVRFGLQLLQHSNEMLYSICCLFHSIFSICQFLPLSLANPCRISFSALDLQGLGNGTDIFTTARQSTHHRHC